MVLTALKLELALYTIVFLSLGSALDAHATPPPGIGAPPEGGDGQRPVRHPLLTDEARQLIDEGTSLGLDAEAIYQQVRVFDGGHKAADGSFVQTSGMVWANNAPAHDPEDPAQTLPMLPDFTVVDPVIAGRVDEAVEGELLDVEIARAGTKPCRFPTSRRLR